MILQLQKEVSLSEDFLVAQGRLFSFLIQIAYQIPGNLSRQAGAQRDHPFVVLFQNFQINTRLIVKPVHVTFGDNFCQI